MKVDEWLQFFTKHREKKLFSLADLAQLTAIEKVSLSVQLTRLVNANVIRRSAHDWYENPFNPPTPEEVAMVLRYPAYLSLEYALSKQGVLNQVAQVLTLITTKLPYTYQTTQAVYEYHQLHPTLFWGYHRQGAILLAEPEKALLDLIYIRYSKNKEITRSGIASLIDDMAVDGFSRQKLQRYARQYSANTQAVLSDVGLLTKT